MVVHGYERDELPNTTESVPTGARAAAELLLIRRKKCISAGTTTMECRWLMSFPYYFTNVNDSTKPLVQPCCSTFERSNEQFGARSKAASIRRGWDAR
ncbi:hypothetical protein EVAR_3796_1 [Eumeta japonica]|uniref:Uncharacterized protein n=1 Tax=Eumeta variegata TaxID=151549 RepID=A0A4C1SUL5_EUMVA|nr:hypothetical protein EVAR_3796_1 [Eumeta japonica]